METHFQNHLLVNIRCGVIGSQIIRPFVLEEHLTSECYFCSWKMSCQCC